VGFLMLLIRKHAHFDVFGSGVFDAVTSGWLVDMVRAEYILNL
jgi:hypothetical protein